MNIYGYFIGVLVWIATVFGGFYLGMEHEKANQLVIKDVVNQTREAALDSAATAISKIVVRNTTVQGKVETIVRDNPVYRDCKHDDAGMRLINEALTGTKRTDRGSVSPLN